MDWKSHRLSSNFRIKSFTISSLPFFFFFLFFFFSFSSSHSLLSSTTSSATCLGFKCPFSAKADLNEFQDAEKRRDSGEGTFMDEAVSIARRLLSGPGSSPPRCTSKCGTCTPCTPVHVPVPPGTPVTAEYYPEAWRCKCGNKLYMP